MSTPLHPDTEMGQVCIRVNDLHRSIEFYERVLGFQSARQTDGSVLLTAGGTPLLKLIEARGVRPFPKRGYAGLYHYAILVPDRATLGLVLRNLIEFRIPIGSSDHLVSEALYIDDPDGHGIEIYADRPRDQWIVSEDGRIKMSVDPLDGQSLLAEAKGTEWTGMPEGTKMGHVHLHVSDLQQANEFYHRIFGFDVTAKMGGSALFVSAGGYHHHLGLNIWAGERVPVAPPEIAALEYFTIYIPEKDSWDRLLERLDEGGYLQKDGTGQFATDPFGIQIRLKGPDS